MMGSGKYDIKDMPFPKALERLAVLVMQDLEKAWRDEGQDPDEVRVTVTRVYDCGAAIVAGHWGDDGEWVPHQVYVDDDQRPWDVLIRLLSDVTSVFPSIGHPRGHCICMNGRDTSVYDLLPMLRRAAYGT